MMHRLLRLSLFAAFSMGALAQGPASSGTAEEMTVITSDKLLYDYRNQFAVFDDNVVVVDPQMKLTADKLTVRFDKNNQIQFIEARGQVYIEQAARGFTARAELVTYHVKEGKIVMEDSPQVVREGKILQGGKITYWRFQDKLESSEGSERGCLVGVKLTAGPPSVLLGHPARSKP